MTRISSSDLWQRQVERAGYVRVRTAQEKGSTDGCFELTSILRAVAAPAPRLGTRLVRRRAHSVTHLPGPCPDLPGPCRSILDTKSRPAPVFPVSHVSPVPALPLSRSPNLVWWRRIRHHLRHCCHRRHPPSPTVHGHNLVYSVRVALASRRCQSVSESKSSESEGSESEGSETRTPSILPVPVLPVPVSRLRQARTLPLSLCCASPPSVR